MNERSLEQRINIRFCMKAAKKASETLALSRMAYGKFAMMKEVFLCKTNSSRIGENICPMTQKLGKQNHKEQI